MTSSMTALYREKQAAWVAALLSWFQTNKRCLPWRSCVSAYAVWVSEIMLQQTQVETVLPYYRRFMKRFPSIRSLAEAPLQDVLRSWEGLGYYARARHLKDAAESVRANHGGRLPRLAADLVRLPGIGEYTAAAIASICFGERIAVVDGNVARVMARLKAIDEDVGRTAMRRCLATELASFAPKRAPGDFNQAMMELGALVCRPRRPHCDVCPLQPRCLAYKMSAVDRFPIKSAAKKIPHREMVAAVVRRKRSVLLVRRPSNGLLGGLWEFPGGPRKPREKLACAVRRCVWQQTQLEVATVAPFRVLKHAYSHFRITLRVLECRPVSGKIKAPAGQAARWIPVCKLNEYPLPAVHRRTADALLAAPADE